MDVIRSNGVAYRHVSGDEPAPAYRWWLESVLLDVAVAAFPGGGHFPHLAHPFEFATILAG